MTVPKYQAQRKTKTNKQTNKQYRQHKQHKQHKQKTHVHIRGIELLNFRLLLFINFIKVDDGLQVVALFSRV